LRPVGDRDDLDSGRYDGRRSLISPDCAHLFDLAIDLVKPEPLTARSRVEAVGVGHDDLMSQAASMLGEYVQQDRAVPTAPMVRAYSRGHKGAPGGAGVAGAPRPAQLVPVERQPEPAVGARHRLGLL